MRPIINKYYVILITVCVAASQGYAQVYLTKNEALSQYLGERYERKTVFLTDDEVNIIQRMAKAKVESKIVTYYSSANRTAFIESRIVRTMPATFIVVVDTAGSIHAVEMLAFYEPEDYLPTKKWMETFRRKTVSDDLWLKRGVYNISGATLSATAITESIRKILTTYSTVIAKDKQ